jgi:hypothetical protein
VRLRATEIGLKVELKTLTPNFKQFEVRESAGKNQGEWRASGNEVEWKLRQGLNRLEARTVNAFGVIGPVSVVETRVD